MTKARPQLVGRHLVRHAQDPRLPRVTARTANRLTERAGVFDSFVVSPGMTCCQQSAAPERYCILFPSRASDDSDTRPPAAMLRLGEVQDTEHADDHRYEPTSCRESP